MKPIIIIFYKSCMKTNLKTIREKMETHNIKI